MQMADGALHVDLTVPTLGVATVRSPLKLSTIKGDRVYNFVEDDECVLMNALGTRGRLGERSESAAAFERAGPRELLFFEPSDLRAGIVTCGGLCPGMNNAIRAATLELLDHYRVREVLGFHYGFAGLNPDEGLAPLCLTAEFVEGIHHHGGSILGSSRGPQEPAVIVDTLQRMDVGLLLVIGGDGGMRGAHAICEEAWRRGAAVSIVGIPKSIDNDVPLVDKTFGYETAFSIAVESIRAAHTEAAAYRNGVGLVRLMGRHSGFIAASAAVAEADADFVLIPEVPLVLDGPGGFLEALMIRLRSDGHVVVVVAEGAGQDLLQEDGAIAERDESGNVRLLDIGAHLKQRIGDELHAREIEHTLKYIDPSYLIRSAPANPSDSVYSSDLARNAVHAGMAGRTGLLVGYWNGEYTNVPLREVIARRKAVGLEDDLWHAVLECTGQRALWGEGTPK
jgi:6-phosphofructokinase 1